MISSEETANKNVEKWKPLIIDQCYFNYWISNYGRIYGTYRQKLIIPEVTNKGYLRINIHWPSHNKHRKFFVHRLVGYLFVPGYSPELTINHKDGKHDNNYYKNLEWVTLEDNEHHALVNNLHPSGNDHPNSKYTDKQIVQVCELLEKGVGCMEISRKTGISVYVIYDIKHRKTWLHISKDYIWEDNMDSIEYRFKKKIIDCLKKNMSVKDILRVLGYKNSTRMKNLINKLKINYVNDCSLTFNDYPYSA